jgi:hypothetical protein
MIDPAVTYLRGGQVRRSSLVSDAKSGAADCLPHGLNAWPVRVGRAGLSGRSQIPSNKRLRGLPVAHAPPGGDPRRRSRTSGAGPPGQVLPRNPGLQHVQDGVERESVGDQPCARDGESGARTGISASILTSRGEDDALTVTDGRLWASRRRCLAASAQTSSAALRGSHTLGPCVETPILGRPSPRWRASTVRSARPNGCSRSLRHCRCRPSGCCTAPVIAATEPVEP